MLSREQMAVDIEKIKKNDLELIEKRQIEQHEAKDQAIMKGVTWGGRESSMINATDMPVVTAMIKRLKGKYKKEFEARGKTDAIRTNAILNDLRTYLENLISDAKKEKPPDKDKIWQYEVALRLFTQKNSATGPSYFHPENVPLNVHGQNLSELLAYLWLAANDKGAILRPVHERNLNKIKDPIARQQAKDRLIEESKIINFVFNLFDIRREHSSDFPAWELDKENDRPSCPGGTLGRLIFKVCPMSAATVLSAEEKTLAEIETASQKEAKQTENQPSIHYDSITHEIENFFMEKLSTAHDVVKKAAYNYFTTLMMGLDEFESDASDVEKEKFKQDKALFDEYLKGLDQKQILIDLIKFLDKAFPNFDLAKKPSLHASVNSIYRLMLSDLSSPSSAKKDPTQIYRNEGDRNFVERIRKEGAKVLQKEGLDKKINTDQEIISYRRQIKELSFMFTSINELIQNEIRRALLGLSTLSTSKITETEKQAKWNEIIEKINYKLRYFTDLINNEWYPRLLNLQSKLSVALDEKIEKVKVGVARDIGFDFVVDQTALTNIKKQAAQTATACEEFSAQIKGSTKAFSGLMSKKGSSQDFNNALNKHWHDFYQVVAPTTADGAVSLWVKEILRVITSKTLENKGRELERLHDLMEICCDKQTKEKILEKVSLEVVKLPDVKNAMELISQKFPEIKENLSSLGNASSGFITLLLSKGELSAIERSGFQEELKRMFQQKLQPLFADFGEDEVMRQIGNAFEMRLKDDVKGDISWQRRQQAILLLSNLFPDKIKELGLEFRACIDLGDLLKQGEKFFGDYNTEACESAETSLLLAKYPEGTTPEIVDSDVVNKNLQNWLQMGKKILGITDDNDVPGSFIQPTDAKFKGLAHFVLLTVCRNLALTDIRLEDKAALERICSMYLTTPEQKNEMGGPMYNLKKDDKLSARLHHLAVHLSCMLTTLKPVSTLFNTGHVRIQDRRTAENLLANPEIKEENKFIIRTSTSSPTFLAQSTDMQHTAIQGTRLDIALPSIDQSESDKSKWQFSFSRPEAIAVVGRKIDSKLTLIPYDKVRQAQQEMQDHYRQVTNNYFRMATNQQSEIERGLYLRTVPTVPKVVPKTTPIQQQQPPTKESLHPTQLAQETKPQPQVAKDSPPNIMPIEGTKTTRVGPELSKKSSEIKISAQRTGVTLFQPNNEPTNNEPKKTKRHGPLKRVKEFIRNIRYRR